MMPFDNCPTDVETDAEADLGAALHIHPLGLVEPLPDADLVLHGNACTVVVDRDPHPAVVSRHTHIYWLACPRELEGVAHIVRDDLFDPLSIGKDRNGGCLREHSDGALGVERPLLGHGLAHYVEELTHP